MNYNSATSITSYDIKSLHHLYPIRQNSDTEPEIGRAKNIQSPYLFEAFSKSDDEIIKTSEL